MALCKNCGEKVGFIRRQYYCEVCKKPYCDRCSPVQVREFYTANFLPLTKSEEIDHYICSISCSYNVYIQYMKNVNPKSINLIEADHISVVLEEPSDAPKQLFIDYMDLDRKTIEQLNSLIPQMRPLYEKIKKDLKKRNINFNESFETYMLINKKSRKNFK